MKKLCKLSPIKISLLSFALALLLNTIRTLRETTPVKSKADWLFIGQLIEDENTAESMLIELQKKLIQ